MRVDVYIIRASPRNVHTRGCISKAQLYETCYNKRVFEMERTRSKWKCALFGDVSDLNCNILPTYEDVIKCFEWNRHLLKHKKESLKEPSYKEVEDIVVRKIVEIWVKASIPTVQNKRVKVMLKNYHLKYKNILKSPTKTAKKKLEEFLVSSKTLFDISSCKCKNIDECSCPKHKKLPTCEKSFLIDQRTARRMVIGTVDTATTTKMNKTLKRKLRSKKPQLRPLNDVPEMSTASSSPDELSQSDNDDIFKPRLKAPKLSPSSSIPSASTSTSVDYNLLSKTCDRFGVSDRAGAAIASVILQTNSDEVIDKNKLRRKRKIARRLTNEKDQVHQIKALYFDGRKDRTLTMSEKDGKHYKNNVVEEHISLIMEPESKFLGYVSPKFGTSRCIEQTIIDYFSKSNISTESLVAVGCDGTNVNVGQKGGVIRLLEERLNRPLQWIICLLHMNELPFRHLFSEIDGKTSGPRSFSGKIGKDLETCEQRPVVNFEPISADLPKFSLQGLSTDQTYLFEIVHAVSTGEYQNDLMNKTPGKMSHARWLTRANRILRLYVSTASPNEKLVVLATYVVKVYAPTWFAIKMHSSCKDGARHFFKLISATRYLSTELRAIIDPVIQRNCFFAHPENLLLAMLSDDNQNIRELAANRILKARSSRKSTVRQFHLPVLRFDSESYTDIIDWPEDISDPPILRSLSDKKIQSLVKKKDELAIMRLPCHTQAVERAVKAVTEASSMLTNNSDREGYIKNQIESRKQMPKFDSKKDFHAF